MRLNVILESESPDLSVLWKWQEAALVVTLNCFLWRQGFTESSNRNKLWWLCKNICLGVQNAIVWLLWLVPIHLWKRHQLTQKCSNFIHFRHAKCSILWFLLHFFIYSNDPQKKTLATRHHTEQPLTYRQDVQDSYFSFVHFGHVKKRKCVPRAKKQQKDTTKFSILAKLKQPNRSGEVWWKNFVIKTMGASDWTKK